MLLAEVSDTVILASITGGLSLIGTVFGGVLTYYMARMTQQNALAAKQAEIAAVKVAEVAGKAHAVKEALQATTTMTQDKLDGLAQVAADTHTLVNSSFAAQLKLTALAMRRIAELTHAPEDVEAAEVAERLFRGHQSKQAVVDRKQP